MEACMDIPENDDKSLNIKEGGFADKNYDLEKWNSFHDAYFIML